MARAMGQRTGGIRRPLQHAGVYSLVQRALGAQAVRVTFVEEHLRPRAGERVLDLGCGPGDILDLLGAVEYVGIDNSPAYVAAGRARYRQRASFIEGDVRELDPEQLGSFDAVISIGVLHHLHDDDALRMIDLAADVLRDGGRLVTIDPAFTEPQPGFAHWLISRDRGQAVRTPAGYVELGERRFGEVCCRVRHDLARVPYTHALLEYRQPR